MKVPGTSPTWSELCLHLHAVSSLAFAAPICTANAGQEDASNALASAALAQRKGRTAARGLKCTGLGAVQRAKSCKYHGFVNLVGQLNPVCLTLQRTNVSITERCESVIVGERVAPVVLNANMRKPACDTRDSQAQVGLVIATCRAGHELEGARNDIG